MRRRNAVKPDSTSGDRCRALRDEDKRIRRMRVLIALITQALYQDRDLSVSDARRLIANLRAAILNLFPGKEATFEIVLRPRLERILIERWGEGLEPHVH